MDLLDQESVDDFKNAMRDVADTFNRYPIILQRVDAADLPLLAGKAPLSSNGSPDGLTLSDEGEEIEDGFLLKLNRDYLVEKGLVDGNDALLIGYDDEVVIDGKQYAISMIDSTGTFRDQDLTVILKVER